MGVPFYCSAKSSTNYYIKNLITISTQLKCNKKHTQRTVWPIEQCEDRQQDKEIRRFPLNFSAEPELCCIDSAINMSLPGAGSFVIQRPA